MSWLTRKSRNGASGNSRRLFRRSRQARRMEWLEDRTLLTTAPSIYYDFDVVAKSGDLDHDGDELLSFGIGPSINAEGKVAFTGEIGLGFGDNSIFVSDATPLPPPPPLNIVPQGSFHDDRFYNPFVQINDDDRVISQFMQNMFSSQPETVLLPWDANKVVEFSDLATARMFEPRVSMVDFDWVDFPSINKSNQAVFVAQEGHITLPAGHNLHFLCPSTCLATPNGGGVPFNIKRGDFGPPAIADDGRIAVIEGTSAGDLVLQRCDYDLDPCIEIAHPTNGFTELGIDTDISDDGKVITFDADLGYGRGIFFAAEESTGTTLLNSVPIAGGQWDDGAGSCRVPELGYDADGDPLCFQEVESGSMAVIHQELGKPGLAEDSIVFAFMATPNAASRANPHGSGPLLFSAEPGIWTVRVDVDAALDDPSMPLFHPTSPLRVAQVGDKIGNREILDLFIGDALAKAATDKSGTARTDRRGDHRIVFWARTTVGDMIVRGRHLDSDEDGLLDHWEMDGLDLDGDGNAELPLQNMKVNPNQRDIFLEIDWLAPQGSQSFAPVKEAIDGLVKMFANAPMLDNGISAGIKLHVDAGATLGDFNMGSVTLQGGDEIRQFIGGPHIDGVYFGRKGEINVPGKITRSMDDIKENFFGTADKGAREFVFHYAVFAERTASIDPVTKQPVISDDAEAELALRSATDFHTIPGNDLIIALEGAASLDNYPAGYLQFAVLAHELGHNLGLRHGGDDLTTCYPQSPLTICDTTNDPTAGYKPRYVSLMNYAYVAGLVGFAPIPMPPAPPYVTADTLTSVFTNFTGIGGRVDLKASVHLRQNLRVRIVASNTPGAEKQERRIQSNTDSSLTVSLDLAPVPDDATFAVLVDSYAGAEDPVFDDWQNLRLDFQNYFDHLGNSFIENVIKPAASYPSVAVLEGLMGPLDREVPAVTINSPTSGVSISAGGSLAVTLTATDDFGIDFVEVSMDADGSGAIDTGETVVAISTGADTFEATLTNFSGPSGLRTIQAVAIDTAGRRSTAATIEISVPNSPPQAVDDSYSVDGDDSLAVVGPVGALSNDSDVNLDLLTASPVSGPANGTLFLNLNGSFTYIPNPGFVGQDTFTYRANDGEFDANPATVTVTVNPPSGLSGPVPTSLLYPAPAFSVGEGPFAVLAGDLNRDGHQDLVTVNHLTDDVSVLLGRGGGAFDSEMRFAAGSIINRRAQLKDTNADGIVDAIAQSSTAGGDSVVLLLGNGDGSFQAPVTTSVNNSLISNGIFAVIDLNDDGFHDIATLRDSFPNREVVVRLGNGDGSFQIEQTFTVTNSSLNQLAADDLDGDGTPDLVVTGLASDVSVFLGNGDGTFSAEQEYTLASSPSWLQILDANADGVMDIFAGTDSARGVSVLLGNGGGTFQQPPLRSPLDVFLSPETSVIVDSNADGFPDLVISDDSSSPQILVHLGNGDGTFQSALSFATAPGAEQLVAADLNGDGLPDLASITELAAGDEAVAIHLGNGDGTLQPVERYLTAGQGNSEFPLMLSIADLNDDAIPDLTVAIEISGVVQDRMTVLFGNGDGTFPTRLGGFATDVFHIKSPTVADLNGDGALDLAIGAAAGLARDVAVLQGEGDGSFRTEPRFAVGDAPHSVTTTDVNDDGILDLAVANSGSDDVSVLLGNSDGTFQLQQRFAVGVTPESIAADDLDGNGTPDLVVANRESDDISVLLGNGNGTFQPQQSFAVGRRPLSVVLADLNGDGILDAAATNSQDQDVSVLLGNGDGTFQPQQRFAVGQALRSITAADLNGNGSLDLAVADANHVVRIMLGNGDGSFQSPQSFAAGLSPEHVVAADLNGDGVHDLATSNSVSNDISVLLGNGDGTFQPEQRFGFAVGSPDSIAVGDMDGNGTLDLAASNAGDNSVTVLLSNGDGTFQADQHFHVSGRALFVVLADLNGDGVLDATSANDDQDEVSVLLGKGDGTLRPRKTFLAGTTPSSVTAADVNSDGFQDLVSANRGSNDVSVLVGIGDGTFQPEQRFVVGNVPESVAISDLDGDGIADLVTANALSRDVSVLLGNVDGSFQAQQRYAVGTSPESVAAWDLNNDGVADLVVANPGSDDISVLLGNGDGTFQPQQRFATGGAPASVAVADLNGDGVLDVVTANSQVDFRGLGGDVSMLLGNGDGTFQPEQRFDTGDSTASVAASDVNSDGIADIIAANQNSGDISVLVGIGDGTFESQQRFIVSNLTRAASVADLNGDGLPDFAVPVANTDLFVLPHTSKGGAGAGNIRPTADAGGPYQATEGAAIALDASGSSDPDGSIALYQWDLDDDGQYGDDTGVSPAAIFGDDGDFVAGLRVTDDEGKTDTNVSLVTVLNAPPSLDAGPDRIANEGDAVNAAADFTDAGVLDTHSATIDWGDGSPSEFGVVAQGAGFGDVTGFREYGDNGTHSVGVCVSDDDGATTCDNFGVTVHNLAPIVVAGNDQTVKFGQLVGMDPAVFSDAGAQDTHTATVDWGDGTVEIGSVLQEAGSGAVVGTHAYAVDGTYTVTVCVMDDDGDEGCDILSVTVAPFIPNQAPVVRADSNQSINEGEKQAYAFAFADPNPDDMHTVTVDWGDGTPQEVVTIFNGIRGTGVGFPVHTYASPGAFESTVCVTDTSGLTSCDVMTVTVLAANTSPLADAGGPYTGDEGSDITLDGSGSTDAENNIAVYNWDLDHDSEYDDATGIMVVFTPIDDGTFTIGLRVTDEEGLSHTDTATVTVHNVAPAADLSNDGPVGEGSTAVASFSGPFDPSSADTIAGFSYSYDFDDDGNYELVDVNEASAVVPAAYLADGPGSHTVRARIEDKDGDGNEYSTTIDILNTPPAVTVANDQQSVQYSDAITPITISATDVATDVLSISTSNSVDGGNNFEPGLPGDLVLSGSSSDGNGVWEIAGVANVEPANYIVRVKVSDEDGGQAETDTALEVVAEDAIVTYSGIEFVSTDSVNTSSAPVLLRAVIQDISAVPPGIDPLAGDIRNAIVEFINRETGSPIATGLPVSLLDESDPTTGVASFEWLADIGNADSEQFTIGIVVSGHYERDNRADDTVVTVAKPLPNFTTGGGYIINQNSSGTHGGDFGLRTNYGFNLKFNKQLTNLKGKTTVIIRSGGRVLQIKTNATRSLVVDPTTGHGIIVSKANLKDVTDPDNPISLGGNLSLEMKVTDRGEPGIDDSIAITLWDGDELLYSSRWDGVRTVEQTIAGGNLKVHGESGNGAGAAAATAEGELSAAAGGTTQFRLAGTEHESAVYLDTNALEANGIAAALASLVDDPGKPSNTDAQPEGSAKTASEPNGLPPDASPVRADVMISEHDADEHYSAELTDDDSEELELKSIDESLLSLLADDWDESH